MNTLQSKHPTKMCCIYCIHQDTPKQHLASYVFLVSYSHTEDKQHTDYSITMIYIYNDLAVIELTPAEVVYICPGGQLNLICKTNSSFM